MTTKKYEFTPVHPLLAISSVDGRYRESVEPLAEIVSEFGLMKYRLQVEVEYFIALAAARDVPLRCLRLREIRLLRSWYQRFSLKDAEIIKRIEKVGYGKIKKGNNHDVNAVVRYLKIRMERTTMTGLTQWIHFALTSEDITNIAYALMLRDVYEKVLLPKLWSMQSLLGRLAQQHSALAMLARTHNQPASPTTLGKEDRVFASRLGQQLEQLATRPIRAKLNGASGNYNAHQAALPVVNWIEFSRGFITKLSAGDDHTIRFEPNLHTTQIEPHDTLAESFDNLKRIAVVLIKLCRDRWQYIGDEWIVQTAVEGEDGSSAMPNKVNPIDWENAEGKLEELIALSEVFSRELPQSRLQRHLSDSTMQRDMGLAFGFMLIALGSISRGLKKSRPNPRKVIEDLERRPEVISEAIQIILRTEGYADAYDQLKDLTRGKVVTLELLQSFIHSIKLPARTRQRLLALRPTNYTGLAEVLAMWGSSPGS